MNKKPENTTKLHDPDFKKAVADVIPLKDSNRISFKNTAKKAINKSRQNNYSFTQTEPENDIFSDGQEMDLIGFEDTLSYYHKSISSRYFSDLKSGRIPIEDFLDLHGMTVLEARKELSSFLSFCQHHQIRCVKIIHGKGYRKQQTHPILKNKVNSWLRQLPHILAFHSALAKDGGTGALYVLLKK